VDRIEVVRGPNAANDGLNSMLGTVHIYTRHSSMTLGGMGEVATGDKDYHEANLRYGTKTGSGSWRLSLRALEDERHGVSHDHATDLQMNFRGDFQPTLHDDVMLEFGASRSFWEGTNVGQYLVDGQHTYYLSGFANLKWRRALGSGREWSLQLDHTFNQNEEDIVATTNGDYRTTGSSIVFNYLDQPIADLRTSLSGEYRLNRVKLPGLLGSDGYVEDNIFRVSGAVEWSLSPHWVLHAGAMLEHHSDTEEAYLSPRLALNWLPSSEHAFRFSMSQGLSALGLYVNNTDIKVITNKGKLDQKFLSSGEVDPEKIDSVELGYLFSKPAWGLNLDVRTFYNRISDIVGLKKISVPFDTKDGNAKSYYNENEVSQKGLEYQLRWHHGPNTWLTLSQSWISTEEDKDEGYPKTVPNYTLSLLVTHRIAGVDVSVGYYRLGEMCWQGATEDSKYNRLDLRLAKDWKTADGRIQAALVFQSLLGEEFEGMTEDPYERQNFERRGYFSLKYEFR
jgi:iron complex outermembrane receptor protein